MVTHGLRRVPTNSRVTMREGDVEGSHSPRYIFMWFEKVGSPMHGFTIRDTPLVGLLSIYGCLHGLCSDFFALALYH